MLPWILLTLGVIAVLAWRLHRRLRALEQLAERILRAMNLPERI